MTADAACRGIRDHDREGTIGMFAAEPYPPYSRPPLSKGLWAGKDESTIWRGTADLGVDVHAGRRVVSIDPDACTVVDDAGKTHGYDRLLLATGGSPRLIPSAGDDVIHFRTLDDFRRLHALSGEGRRAVVIGGGFIGSEIAAALATNGCAVTMVFPEAGIGARLLPTPLSDFVSSYYRTKGVEVITGALVEAISRQRDALLVETDGGRALDADVVVAGLGIVPATELAEAAALPVEDGIVVDEYGRVDGRDDLFAAGDVARFPVAALGGTRRVEHEDHANTHGRVVGANMAGAATPYDHLPFFYSDLFDLGYEAVGDVDSRLGTIEEWAEQNRKGVVGYVDEAGRARGFLLWDTWGKVDAARNLIRSGVTIDEDALRSLLD